MIYSLEDTSVNGCLRICVSGTWPHRQVDGIIADFIRLWEEYRQPVLIDIRNMRGTPSILDDFKDAKRFAASQFWRLGDIAVLDCRERKDANDFLETAAINRGVRFHFFYGDQQEAIDWLSKKGRP